MKKKSILLLILICMISFCILTGLLIFAFELQMKKDSIDRHSGENITATATPSISKTENSGKDKKPDPVDTNDDPSSPAPTTALSSDKPVILGFAGDVNLDENNPPAIKYDSTGKGVLGLLSKDLLKEMKAANVMMLNNEFSYSMQGIKTPDKSFTFRANPDRVNILKDMGVDIVSLANNHALDYGKEALLDTFDTLTRAGIDYVGAGENMDRAKAPIYKNVGGKRIAFLSASRVIFAGSWYATDNTPGMVGTYDPSLILESIKEAKANSDYVVIFVHWGIERADHPLDYQRNLAKQYIDAGADAVIGCHPHVMQGFEFYKGKPIAYSLGNFVFTSTSNKSGLLKLYIDNDGSVRMQLRPVIYQDTFTYLLTNKSEKKEYFNYMKNISFNIDIDDDGFITSKE